LLSLPNTSNFSKRLRGIAHGIGTGVGTGVGVGESEPTEHQEQQLGHEKLGNANKIEASLAGASELAKQLCYIAGGSVRFLQPEKLKLADLLADGNTPAELKSGFRTFLNTIDTENPRNLEFGARNFVGQADQLVYNIRRKEQEATSLSVLMTETGARRRAKAEAEMAEFESERQAEAEMAEEGL
jgi:hypothetical protein